MPEAVVDSNVIFAFRSRHDQYHVPAREIVRTMDGGELPRGLITNYTLPEVLNPIEKGADHDRAVETLDFLTESGGFEVRHLAAEDLRRGRALFRREGIEITDAIIVAFMRRTDTEFIYSFDDDFDRFEDVTRLDTAVDPFEPDR